MAFPSVERLRQALRYDAESGRLFWAARPHARSTARQGDLAGCARAGGYSVVRLDGRLLLSHRAAFALMTSSWPAAEIDHINGDRSDNRWLNLREATKEQNCANAGARSHNRVGLRGVFVCKRAPTKFKAYTNIGGRSKHLGTFDCPAAAHLAHVLAVAKERGEFSKGASR